MRQIVAVEPSAGLVEKMRLLLNGALELRKAYQGIHNRAERVELKDAALAPGLGVKGIHHIRGVVFHSSVLECHLTIVLFHAEEALLYYIHNNAALFGASCSLAASRSALHPKASRSQLVVQ